MKRFIPILVAAMAFATACTNDATSPTVSIAGTWNLRTLNGQPLPAQLDLNTVVTSEQLTLNSDGSYNDIVYYSSGNYSTELGYYTVNNNAINFVDQTDNVSYAGSISGSVLTTISNSNNGSFTSVYQKS